MDDLNDREDLWTVRPASIEEEREMPGWDVLEPPQTAPFLPSNDPIVQALGQPKERFLPPLDVIDWWEHQDPDARVSPSGIAGVPRQLIITTKRIIVTREGSVERSYPIRAVAGAEVRDSLDGQNQGSEKAVLVKSHDGQEARVLGMWSMTPAEASQVMDIVFKFSHGLT
jgi:hypothetical protein